MRRIEDLGYNVEKHQYICRDVVGVRVKNIIYFFKLRVVGKHDKKNIGKPWKNPFVFKVMKGTKKDIMNVINVNILVDESQISYSKINWSEKDFMDNIYDLGLSIFY